MRLNFGRRLVLFINWLLSLAGCALAVTLFVWPKCMETMLALLERKGLTLKLYVIAVLIVYLIFAVGAVCIIFGGKKSREKGAFIVVDSSETGHSRIAVSAVNQMIRQAVRGVDGIAEMKANIIDNENSIDIAADVAIRNGVHVPTVTANIQRAIRGYIEQNCGITVRKVGVSVHTLTGIEEENWRTRKKKTKVASKENKTPVGNEVIDAAAPEWPAKDEPVAAAQPLPENPSFDEPEEIPAQIPDIADEGEAEPESFELPGEDEPIRLTLDPEVEVPAVEPFDQPAEEPAEEPIEEAPAAVEEAPTAVEEAPVVEPAPEEPAPKKRLFGRLFGRREKAAPASSEPAAPVETVESAEPVEPAAEEVEAYEPAAEASAAEEYAADEPAAEDSLVEEFADAEPSEEEPEPWSAWDEDKPGQD